MNAFTIITPCSRPQNLLALKASIDFKVATRWIVVHDCQAKPFVKGLPDDEKVEEVPCYTRSKSGNGPRNLGLSMVHDGFVYFLDDDNVVHPKFWSCIAPILRPGNVVTFDMQYGNGRVLRGSDPRPQKIDTAMCAFDRSACVIEWDLHEYIADGIFIEKLVAQNRERWAYIPVVAAYYNRLRDDYVGPFGVGPL